MRDKTGSVLFAALVMIGIAAGVILMCTSMIGLMTKQSRRYQITLQRIEEIKKALFGKMVNVRADMDIENCGGFISDYGKPDNVTGNCISYLLQKPSGWKNWSYDNATHFFSGYRGSHYLNANAEGNKFIDGWGNEMQVHFDSNKINIKSLGSDGKEGGNSTYAEDIIEDFYYKRDVELTICFINNSPDNYTGNVTAEIIYPEKGGLLSDNKTKSVFVEGNNDNETTFSFSSIPVGLRKVNIKDNNTIINKTKALYIPYTLVSKEYKDSFEVEL
ncbi:hypothetical protein J7J45_03060 [Candidatus Aerophobetes bacterium]|nr:hypothetical protein [Candidatus Aerophobetes bacterium]